MSLPTTRNTTYNASDAIKSADLNAFQDQITGTKHPSRLIPISGAAFQIASGAPTKSNAGLWTFPLGSAAEIIADLPLPFSIVGTRINALKWSHRRDTAVGGPALLTFTLRKRSVGDGGVTSASPFSDGVGAGNAWTTFDSVAAHAPYTTEANFFYVLSVVSNGSGTGNALFDGLQVGSDRL